MTRLQRAVASLAAMTAGWAGGYFIYVAGMTCCTEPHRATDQEAMLFWSAIFVAVSWLLVALPIALLMAPDSRIVRFPAGALLGAATGVMAFLLLLSWSGLWREPLFLAYAAGVGAVAGLTYGPALRLTSGRKLP